MEKIKKFQTKLELWLWLNRIQQAALARELGITRQRVNDWVSGRMTPGKRNAARIAAYTGGRVTEMDLLYPERARPAELIVSIGPDGISCQH